MRTIEAPIANFGFDYRIVAAPGQGLLVISFFYGVFGVNYS